MIIDYDGLVIALGMSVPEGQALDAGVKHKLTTATDAYNFNSPPDRVFYSGLADFPSLATLNDQAHQHQQLPMPPQQGLRNEPAAKAASGLATRFLESNIPQARGPRDVYLKNPTDLILYGLTAVPSLRVDWTLLTSHSSIQTSHCKNLSIQLFKESRQADLVLVGRRGSTAHYRSEDTNTVMAV